jgi:uncharacterized protein YdaU (DUF1376 family)
MPLYIADYLKDTGHLSAAEHGAYLMLIMHYWSNGGVPTDERKLARIARMTPEEWAESRDTIAEFFGEGWKHGRIDNELAEAAVKSDSARTSAKKRWDKRKPCEPDANALPTHMHSECLSPSLSQTDSSDRELSTTRERARSPETELRVAIVDVYREAGQPMPPETGHCAVWLAQGFPAELCLSVIRSKMPGARDKGLKWFDKPIAEAFTTTPAKKPDKPIPGEEIVKWDGHKMPAKNLEFALRRYAENPATWLGIWGEPPPDVPFLVEYAAARGIQIKPREKAA